MFSIISVTVSCFVVVEIISVAGTDRGDGCFGTRAGFDANGVVLALMLADRPMSRISFPTGLIIIKNNTDDIQCTIFNCFY